MDNEFEFFGLGKEEEELVEVCGGGSDTTL